MYKDKNLVPQDATYDCDSPHYYHNNNITLNNVSKGNLTIRILAVRCDNVVECHSGLDEEDCKNDILNYYYLVLVLVLLTGTSIGLQNGLEKVVRRFGASDKRSEMQVGDDEEMFIKDLLHCQTKEDMLKLKTFLEERHRNKNMEDVNLSMAALQYISAIDRKEKKRLNKLFYETEVKVHHGKAEALICFKSNIG